MMRYLQGGLLFIMFLVFLSGISAVAAYTPDANAFSQQQQEILKFVNQQRTAAGVPMLKMANADATKAAMYRAYEITKSFAHVRPNGAGIHTVLYEYGVKYSQFAENIAKFSASPSAVVNAWMNSTSHRKSMLRSEYTYAAVGVYQDNNGQYYWSLLLIK